MGVTFVTPICILRGSTAFCGTQSYPPVTTNYSQKFQGLSVILTYIQHHFNAIPPYLQLLFIRQEGVYNQ